MKPPTFRCGPGSLYPLSFRHRYIPTGGRDEGESLLEVVLAIGLVATLALTAAQTQINQSRVQRSIHERMTAMALLDALAEVRRMQIDESMATGVSSDAWQARAASTLPDGRLTVRRVSDIADRLSVSWRRQTLPIERAAQIGTTDRNRRCHDPDPQRRCESIDVPLREPSVRLRGHLGHTLIELLIASALGASVIAAALMLQQRVTRDNARVAELAQMQMDGLAARDLLRAYTLLAGYGAHSTVAGGSGGIDLGAPVRGCIASAQGTEREGNGNCGISEAAGDGVAIRYLADPISVWRSGARDAPADCEGVALDNLRGNAVRAYLRLRAVATSNERRLHCSSRPGVAGQPMVGGLDDLQLRYWIDAASVPLRAEHLNDDDWHRVRGVEACVVVKGRVRTSLPASMSTDVGCGSSQGGGTASSGVDGASRARPNGDGYRRLFLRLSVALRNKRHA